MFLSGTKMFSGAAFGGLLCDQHLSDLISVTNTMPQHLLAAVFQLPSWTATTHKMGRRHQHNLVFSLERHTQTNVYGAKNTYIHTYNFTQKATTSLFLSVPMAALHSSECTNGRIA